ncbi:MAG: hypothetical protein PWP03_23 [Candidatus Woesearchaeota archaeon]|nr:hypothetical protein [Candidatus Woesearchaeota archaeon]MDN5327385.1 hypothetical protein [Candidatus Woesearchaeota archaeon]
MAPWSFWDEFRRLQEEMDRMFERVFGRDYVYDVPQLTHYGRKNEWVPADYREPLADIFETDKEIIATIELPGVDKKDIDVNLRDDGLEIKVEKKDEHKQEDKKKGFYRIERRYSGFYRFIPLPEYADRSKIDATYNNGVLELRIPKIKNTKNKGNKIPVK